MFASRIAPETSATAEKRYCIFLRRDAEDAEDRREKNNRLCGAPRQNAWRVGRAPHAPHERGRLSPVVMSLLFTRADSPLCVKA